MLSDWGAEVMVFFNDEDESDVRDWAQKYLWPVRRGRYLIGVNVAYFESRDDAAWFKLVWGK